MEIIDPGSDIALLGEWTKHFTVTAPVS